MNHNENTTQDPAAIERDIKRTQEDMSKTVDRIGDQLTPKNIFNALLDKADENDVDARMLLDGARRNPIALGLIAAGAIWLVSDKDSKFPSTSGSKSDDDNKWDSWDDSDSHHRDYVSHMSSVEMRDGEDMAAYQRRRDAARSTFLMCERKPDEDDHGFRERLDSMTDKFREKRRAWSDSFSQAGTSTRDGARHAMESTQDTARMAVDKTRDFYDSNPLVGGILAAAFGAALGSGLPITRTEQDKLGSVGEKVRETASEQKDEIASKLHDAKDEALDTVDEKIQQSGSKRPAGEQSSQQPGRSPAFDRA